jgi:hypothetical protein
MAAAAVMGGGNELLSPAEFMVQHTLLIQLLCISICAMLVMLLATLQPTSIRPIVYVNRGLVIYFFICGAIICPFIMPLVMPDSTGEG